MHPKATVRGQGPPDSVEGSPQEVEGRDSGEMVHVSDTKGGGREPRPYLSGYFRIRGHGPIDSIEGSPQEVEGRDLGEMVHVSNTKGGREPRPYLSGYFIIRVSKVEFQDPVEASSPASARRSWARTTRGQPASTPKCDSNGK